MGETHAKQVHTASQRTSNELQQQLSDVKAAQQLSTTAAANANIASASTVAREAAHDAVGVLGRRLEERLGDQISRCDKAVASCEHYSASIEERLHAFAV